METVRDGNRNRKVLKQLSRHLPSGCFLPPSTSPPPSIFDTSHISGRQIQPHSPHIGLNNANICNHLIKILFKLPIPDICHKYHKWDMWRQMANIRSCQLGNDLPLLKQLSGENPEIKSNVHSRSARYLFPS